MTTASLRRSHLRMTQLILAGVAAWATLALFGAASPTATPPVSGPGSVRLVDNDDQQAQQQQIDQQTTIQAEQQAEQQNEAAQQQAQQDELQGQQVEAQAGNP